DSGANGKADPGELVTTNIPLINNGGAPTTNLTATLQLGGGVLSIPGTNPQNYGALAASGGSATRPFTFKVDPNLACGSNVTLTFALQDGATNLGNAIFTVPTGSVTTSTPLTQNFDAVVAPALPAGWVASNASGAALWTTSTTSPDTSPNDAFIDDPASISDKRLDTPSIAIPAGATAQVSFKNNYTLESTFDGGVLEISSPNINAGAFTDITNAAVGGSFSSGGYNGTVSSSFSNPLAGRAAWTGTAGGYLTTTASLGPNVAGQTIKLRFRMGSDTSVSAAGWRIDTITVTTQGQSCQAPTAARVSVSGRVLTSDGAGLRNAVVNMRDANGRIRTAITSAFGYYRFDNVDAGNYVMAVSARKFTYQARIISVNDELTEENFTPQQ
ncbi:MAG: carboxypeptidase regulatory-like domain-containing protein, partial [Acidobacteria bacterium]|nr:carboxypeptidase regulatory-like domain-containing protein [Acidobacteriota bacterium]